MDKYVFVLKIKLNVAEGKKVGENNRIHLHKIVNLNIENMIQCSNN